MEKDFSKVSTKFLKKITSIIGIIFLLLFFYICFEIYVPVNPGSHETIVYTVQKGWGDSEIAANLQKLGIIKSSYFFRFYVVISLQHSSLQAGEYSLSPKMSIYQIAKAMAQGDVIRQKIVILEGWDTSDIANYLQLKGICLATPDPAKSDKQDFISLTKKDYSNEFSFLSDKAKNVGLEGYLFPDTYEVAKGEICQDVLSTMLENFGKKLTPDLRDKVKTQKKSIFDIVTIASMLEKEVKTLDDKKIVSGILWKRLSINMPLQLDSTIIYITGNPEISNKDKTIDSPYNTYKYYGLPKGPISNPGIDSINAAINPVVTKYWYYLTRPNGYPETIFSETLDEHNAAKAKYLGS